MFTHHSQVGIQFNPFLPSNTFQPSPFRRPTSKTPSRGCKREVRNFSQSGTLKNPKVTSAGVKSHKGQKKKTHEGETHGKMSVPAPSKGWYLNPKGLLNGTLYHPFGTPWRVQVYSYSYIMLPIKYHVM